MKKVLLHRLFFLSFLMLGTLGVMAQTYCTPTSSNPCTGFSGNPTISNVTVGAINNNSACSAGSYMDYSSSSTYPTIETTLASPSTGVPYSVTALHADWASPYAVGIWIDLNNDGVFTNTPVASGGERVAERAASADCAFPNANCMNVVKSGTLSIPAGVTPGIKRMRVRMMYTAVDPCANTSNGEAEDYRVIITGTVPTTDITVGTITPLTYCAGDVINTPFTITGTFTAGNVFKAELSDASGSFAAPVNLGTLNSTAAGTVNGLIPANTPYGTGYKVRIISSNPADTSSNNSVTITINDRKPVSVSIGANPSGSICAGSSVTFTALPTNGGSTPSYQWQVNGNNVGTNSPNFTTTSLNNNDSVKVILTSNATCATGSPAFSSTIIMSVGASFNAGTVAAQTNPICAGEQAALNVTGNSGPVQWRSSTDGSNFTNISGATSNSFSETPAQTTYYQVTGGSGNCTATSNTVQLVVNPLPTPPVITTSDTVICSSDSTQICASGGSFTTYNWNTGGTGTCTYAKNAGGVWLDITDANGCGARSNRINISVYSVSSVSIIRQGDTLTSFGAVTYQWIKNGVDITGATLPYYVADGPGEYAVRISDANGCFSTSASVSITVGIDEVYFAKDISIFPNPASGKFNLQYSGKETMRFQLTLYNLIGESVKEDLVNFNGTGTQGISLAGLSAGVYMIQLQSEQHRITRKLIVE